MMGEDVCIYIYINILPLGPPNPGRESPSKTFCVQIFLRFQFLLTMSLSILVMNASSNGAWLKWRPPRRNQLRRGDDHATGSCMYTGGVVAIF